MSKERIWKVSVLVIAHSNSCLEVTAKFHIFLSMKHV